MLEVHGTCRLPASPAHGVLLPASLPANRHDVTEKEKGSSRDPTTERVQIRSSPLEVTPALAGSVFSGSPTHPSAAPEAPGADERLPNLAAVERVGVCP